MGTVINHSGSDTQCFISDGAASGREAVRGGMFTLVLLLELSSRQPCVYGGFILYACHESGKFCRSSVR